MTSIEEAILSRKRLVIFGAGAWGRRLFSEHVMNVAYFLDNAREKQGGYIGNIPIFSPDALRKENPQDTIVLIASQQYAAEIAAQAAGLGFIPGENAVFYSPSPQAHPSAIRMLRYNVTYRCNSRCATCTIWKDSGGEELSPQAFGEILEAPAFSSVEQLYITGGEPTLRADFPRYIEQAILRLKGLKFISTVTNGLLVERTKAIMQECHDLCKKHQVHFYVYVSVDGIGKVHEQLRGVPGSFRKAVAVIDALKGNAVSVGCSTTISVKNVWNLDRLRMYFLSNNLPASFKIGRQDRFFSKHGQEEGIFDFTQEQIHQILLFDHKRFYAAPAGSFHWYAAYHEMMTLLGKERRLACGYVDGTSASLQQNSVLRFCCSRSPDTQTVSAATAEDVLQKEYERMDFFRHTICSQCASDVFAPPGEQMAGEIADTEYWKAFLSHEGFERHYPSFSFYRANARKSAAHTVLITGGWGEEDIWQGVQLEAWIGGRLERGPEVRIVVCSTHPFVTRRTLSRFPAVQVVPVFDRDFLARIAAVDELVVFSDTRRHPWSKWAARLAEDRGIPVCYTGDLFDEEQAYLLSHYLPEHRGETMAISCWIDADMGKTEQALQAASRLSGQTQLPCRFYAMNNFCLAPFGDNRDAYFSLVPKVFGEAWESVHWIDERLADMEKTAAAMLSSRHVIVCGESAKRLAAALQVNPYMESGVQE